MRRIELTISNLLAEVRRLTSDNNRLRIEVAGLQAWRWFRGAAALKVEAHGIGCGFLVGM